MVFKKGRREGGGGVRGRVVKGDEAKGIPSYTKIYIDNVPATSFFGGSGGGGGSVCTALRFVFQTHIGQTLAVGAEPVNVRAVPARGWWGGVGGGTNKKPMRCKTFNNDSRKVQKKWRKETQVEKTNRPDENK